MNNSSLISLSHPQVDFEDDYITPFIRKLEDQRMVFSDNLRDVQRITKAFRLVELSEIHIDKLFSAKNWQNMKKIMVKVGFQIDTRSLIGWYTPNHDLVGLQRHRVSVNLKTRLREDGEVGFETLSLRFKIFRKIF